MSINKRLKAVLFEQKMTIKEAASKCDMPYRSLQNYLSGDREPNANALITIGTRMGINLDWLLTGRGKMMADENQAHETIDMKSLKWLELFENLDAEGQKNILQDIEKEQQLTGLRKELKGLKSTVEKLKNAG